ncbi:MAG: DinB family protein [Ignavibacteria bacterium]|nr:DinB family protein [Ignavibacteria bacterium]
MTYGSLAEILAAKESAFRNIERRTLTLNREQANFRPAGGGWSIQDILEHLSIVESQLIRLIATLTDKAAAATGPNPPLHAFEVSLEPYLEQSRTEKYVTRDKFEPTGTVKAADSLKVLHDVQRELLNLRPRLQSVDPTLVRFPHWVFGPLDLAQWLAFVGVHEERHLGQIHAIISTAEFKLIPTRGDT